MLGWSISASACRSASNRAMTCSVSMPGLMTFTATRRRTGCVCSADVDRAHAALAEQLDDVIRPDLRRQRRAGRAMADVGTGGGLGLGVVEAGRSVMIHASL